jgi:hypothetical protein
MKTLLGRLQKVDLREVWVNESANFTPWLAQDDNILLLGEAIGIDMEVQTLEKEVGPFRADIVCRETQGDRTVLIENQIEMTDHNHLGQIITYSAGIDAAVVVWIAKEFAAEHRAALDWLNEKTCGGAHFFGVEIEVLRIGKSEPAPRFNVVCRPNDWQDSVRRDTAELNDTQRLRLEYWTTVERLLRQKKSPLRFATTGSRSWQRIRAPIRCCDFGFWVSVRDKCITVYMGSTDPKDRARIKELLKAKRKQLEKETGVALTIYSNKTRDWVNAEMKADPCERSDWPRQHDWLRATGEKFTQVFPAFLKS